LECCFCVRAPANNDKTRILFIESGGVRAGICGRFKNFPVEEHRRVHRIIGRPVDLMSESVVGGEYAVWESAGSQHSDIN
jgi:hypothetical protein